MVVTVTMNPAIDKTVEIDELLPGGLNRIQKVEYDAGGKGINVSKTIHELGGKSIAAGFLGGNAGRTIEAVLNDCGIQNDFIWVDGETRTNTKVFEKSGEVTELNEPGPQILAQQAEQLIQKLESYAGEETLIVLAGSIPNGVDRHIYEQIIQRVHRRGAKVLLDADGDLFRNGLKAGPDIIKPNRVELEEYAGYDYRASMDELLKTARDFRKIGVETVAVSMGRGGAMMVREGYEVICPALSVKAHSTVGAGDAMVAALAYAWDHQLDDEQTVRLCMAASAGAVTTIGTKPPKRELVDELAGQVVIEPVQGV
ncbi:MAG: 1-phosphofructokinase [Eubacterium sp.]|nr:1-phosphofructokinase [Eubacterium sp.]MCI8918825.1 1-phosphofructokinase [Eubacterium sp.]